MNHATVLALAAAAALPLQSSALEGHRDAELQTYWL
jgi:hypothetical protein